MILKHSFIYFLTHSKKKQTSLYQNWRKQTKVLKSFEMLGLFVYKNTLKKPQAKKYIMHELVIQVFCYCQHSETFHVLLHGHVASSIGAWACLGIGYQQCICQQGQLLQCHRSGRTRFRAGYFFAQFGILFPTKMTCRACGPYSCSFSACVSQRCAAISLQWMTPNCGAD